MVFTIDGNDFLNASKSDPVDIKGEIEYMVKKLQEKYGSEGGYTSALKAMYQKLCVEGKAVKARAMMDIDKAVVIAGIKIVPGPESDPANGYINFTRACAAIAVLCWNLQVLPPTMKSALSHACGYKKPTASGVNVQALIVPGIQYIRENLSTKVPPESFFLEACIALDLANGLRTGSFDDPSKQPFSTMGAYQRHHPSFEPANWPFLDPNVWEPTGAKGSEKVRQTQTKGADIAQEYLKKVGLQKIGGKYVKVTKQQTPPENQGQS